MTIVYFSLKDNGCDESICEHCAKPLSRKNASKSEQFSDFFRKRRLRRAACDGCLLRQAGLRLSR
jgi:hypothetical protein